MRKFYMNQIAKTFIGSMLTDKFVEFGGGIVCFTSISIGYQSDVDNIQDRLISGPQLCCYELAAIGTQGFVVQSQVHFFVVPNVGLAWFRHLEFNPKQIPDYPVSCIRHSLHMLERCLLIDTIVEDLMDSRAKRRRESKEERTCRATIMMT